MWLQQPGVDDDFAHNRAINGVTAVANSLAEQTQIMHYSDAPERVQARKTCQSARHQHLNEWELDI